MYRAEHIRYANRLGTHDLERSRVRAQRGPWPADGVAAAGRGSGRACVGAGAEARLPVVVRLGATCLLGTGGAHCDLLVTRRLLRRKARFSSCRLYFYENGMFKPILIHCDSSIPFVQAAREGWPPASPAQGRREGGKGGVRGDILLRESHPP